MPLIDRAFPNYLPTLGVIFAGGTGPVWRDPSNAAAMVHRKPSLTLP
jgi:hypothetical protein